MKTRPQQKKTDTVNSSDTSVAPAASAIIPVFAAARITGVSLKSDHQQMVVMTWSL